MNDLAYSKIIAKQIVAGTFEHPRVNTNEFGDLVVLSYNRDAIYANEWSQAERASRGLIVNKVTGEVVALPFSKFFNWRQPYGECNIALPSPDSHLKHVFEKLDGSLGILYRDGGEFKISTRGSLQSDQATWATKFLQTNYDLTRLPDNLTLLFEILYPDNRIVVDYEEKEDLVLLGAIDRFQAVELPFYPDVYAIGQQYGFTLPQVYEFNNPAEILEAAAKLEGVAGEGYVLQYSDGQRFKIKADDYVEIHRLISNLTTNKVFQAVLEKRVDTLVGTMPDEFREEILKLVEVITLNYDDAIMHILAHYYEKPKCKTQKEFALWVQANVPSELHNFMYRLEQGHGIDMADIAKVYNLVPKNYL